MILRRHCATSAHLKSTRWTGSCRKENSLPTDSLLKLAPQVESFPLSSREHLSDLHFFDTGQFQTRSILCRECSYIEACHDKVWSFIEFTVRAIQERAGRKVFRCIDLDGILIKVSGLRGKEHGS